MTRDLDVIVYGTVCLDQIWRVDELAVSGAYQHIREERAMIGGEAANTAMALSRWGLRVALIGTAMGDDADGRTLREMFRTDAAKVDISGIATVSGAKTPYCVCIATPDGHRTMYGSGFEAMQCPVLNAGLAGRARTFTMDPNAYEAGAAASRVAAAAGALVVAMDYTQSRDVTAASALSVTSHERVPGGASLSSCAAYAREIRDRDGATTIVTCGEKGCFVAAAGAPRAAAVHIPAYIVEPVVDSTGAGDIFRAGLIFGLLQDWNIEQTARFASAAAGLNCMSMGGWGGVRSVAEINAFQRTARQRREPTI